MQSLGHIDYRVRYPALSCRQRQSAIPLLVSKSPIGSPSRCWPTAALSGQALIISCRLRACVVEVHIVPPAARAPLSNLASCWHFCWYRRDQYAVNGLTLLAKPLSIWPLPGPPMNSVVYRACFRLPHQKRRHALPYLGSWQTSASTFYPTRRSPRPHRIKRLAGVFLAERPRH
jgi:hypothetical protein